MVLCLCERVCLQMYVHEYLCACACGLISRGKGDWKRIPALATETWMAQAGKSPAAKYRNQLRENLLHLTLA